MAFLRNLFCKLKSEYALNGLVQTIFNLDTSLTSYQELYILGRKSDIILRRITQIKEYVNSHRGLVINGIRFRELVELPIENLEQVFTLLEHLALLFRRAAIASQERMKKTEEELQNKSRKKAILL